MTSNSFWYEDIGLERRPPLGENAECDLVVVGSGIAGLSTAYEAARFGWKVIVIDRAATIGGVMTPRTTAHLATELDDYYHRLIAARGAVPIELKDLTKAAKNVAKSQKKVAKAQAKLAVGKIKPAGKQTNGAIKSADKAALTFAPFANVI